MDRPPTIRDVARAASVGASTVSLALRHDRRLRPAMRAHIQKIAAELGYRTNATVANLMAQLRASKTPKFQATIAFVNASNDNTMLQEIATFREWVHGCTSRAQALGYGLDYFWINEPGVTPARLGSILEARGINGLIIAAIQEHGTLPERFGAFWSRFASVVIGMRMTEPPLHFVANDQYSTAFRTVEEVLKLGYTRPGLVISSEIDEWLDFRFTAGFRAGQNRIPPGQQLPVCPFAKNGIKAFRAWMDAHRPDVVICLHEEVKTWIEEMRLKIPQQIGLVHLDRTADMTAWAGMNQNSEQVGAAALDLVVAQLHRNESGVPPFSKSIMIESSWVEGPTVRRQTKPPARKTAAVRTKTVAM